MASISEHRRLHGEIKRIVADHDGGWKNDAQVIGLYLLGIAGNQGNKDLFVEGAGLLDQNLFGTEVSDLQQEFAMYDIGLNLERNGRSEVGIALGDICPGHLIAGGLLNGLSLDPGQNGRSYLQAGIVVGRRSDSDKKAEQGDADDANAEEVFICHDRLPFQLLLLVRVIAIAVPLL